MFQRGYASRLGSFFLSFGTTQKNGGSKHDSEDLETDPIQLRHSWVGNSIVYLEMYPGCSKHWSCLCYHIKNFHGVQCRGVALNDSPHL